MKKHDPGLDRKNANLILDLFNKSLGPCMLLVAVFVFATSAIAAQAQPSLITGIQGKPLIMRW